MPFASSSTARPPGYRRPSQARSEAAKWAGEVEAGFSGKLHENSSSQPPRWLNSGRDNGSVSDRDRHATTRSNAKKSSSLVKSSLRPTPRLSTWKTIPPGECRLGRDIHGFLSRYPSLVNLVAVTFSPLAVTFSPQSAWPKPPSEAMVKCMKNDSSGAKAIQSKELRG